MQPNSIKDILQDSGLLTSLSYTSGQIVVSMLLAFALSLLVFNIYGRTYKGVGYSRNFGLTLILVSLISSVIVIAISGNLALSLGMIGALSIIRFRSAIKDPRDIAFLFWAVCNGIVSGVFIYKLAIISNIVIAATILYFSKEFVQQSTYLLVVSGWNIPTKRLVQKVKDAAKTVKIRYEHISQSEQEIHIEVSLKNPETFIGETLQSIKKDIEEIKHITAISSDGVLDNQV